MCELSFPYLKSLHNPYYLISSCLKMLTNGGTIEPMATMNIIASSAVIKYLRISAILAVIIGLHISAKLQAFAFLLAKLIGLHILLAPLIGLYVSAG